MFAKSNNAYTSGSATVTIRKGRNEYLLSDEPLAPVNKEKILKDFKIVEEAKRAGEKELPPQNLRIFPQLNKKFRIFINTL